MTPAETLERDSIGQTGGWDTPRRTKGAVCSAVKGPGNGVSLSAETGAAGPDAVDVLGMRIHNVKWDEVFALIEQRIVERTPGYIVTPNVDHLCQYHRNGELRAAYRDSFLALADGVPIIWVSHLLGAPLREKISGSDLVPWLAERLAARGHTLFLLGAAEGVAEEAARILVRRHPTLRIAGTYSPPMGFERDPSEISRITNRLREAHPDVCFVAFGSPKQECWMHRYCRACGVPVMIGVGGSLDFITGKTTRAPRWLQRIGLEWVWRLAREPRRLWRRYLVDDRLFFVLVWRALRGKKPGPTF